MSSTGNLLLHSYKNYKVESRQMLMFFLCGLSYFSSVSITQHFVYFLPGQGSTVKVNFPRDKWKPDFYISYIMQLNYDTSRLRMAHFLLTASLVMHLPACMFIFLFVGLMTKSQSYNLFTVACEMLR